MDFDLLSLLHERGALLEGHFLLTSGKHSDRYIEKFRLLEWPDSLDAVGQAMAEGISPDEVDVVLGAAVGGILLAGAVARILGRRTMFTERVDGAMTLRRGFALSPDDRVLVVEDIVTTGGSVFELLEVVRAAGATVQSVVCLVDRSEQGIEFGEPGRILLRLPIATWEPEDCPLCRREIQLVKPGRSGKR
ncbi:MAG: orotate phosphoribosyltransferase [Fidelibacterota bacterium]|nr:MAG: orotate phosphoribosyltransferase [Candidatus Neomarinimicrobiota bacterium]